MKRLYNLIRRGLARVFGGPSSLEYLPTALPIHTGFHGADVGLFKTIRELQSHDHR
jgi:hypothetical protein